VDANNIYGPMEAGFTSSNFACLGSEEVSGGHDTKLAEYMAEHICQQGVTVLDTCGGHANPYHYHERLDCLYTDDPTTGHSTRVGTAMDGNGIYGHHIDGGVVPCDLDACGGRTGVTPDSGGERVYYYVITSYAPFTLGCFGKKDHFTTVEECRALYPEYCTSANEVNVTTDSGTDAYTIDCPCFDTYGSNTNKGVVPAYYSAEEVAALPINACASSTCVVPDRATLRSYVEFVNAGNASSIPDAACASANMSEWQIGAVTSLQGVFQDMTNIGYVDLSGWDTSEVTTMDDAFYGASNFNADLSAFNVSRVTRMMNTFRGASAFAGSGLEDWDTSSVLTLESAFRSATSFNGDIGRWTTSAVTTMARAFYGATSFNADVSNMDVSSVTSLMAAFREATAFDRDLSAWPITSELTNLQHAFRDATSFQGTNGMNGWDTSNVNIMKYAFGGCASFNGDISGWSVERVTNFENMFDGAAAFNQNISRWVPSSTPTTTDMFAGADALDQCIRANI